jgi:CRP/FNR family cyclic AMP-dependent transcriptional regulator
MLFYNSCMIFSKTSVPFKDANQEKAAQLLLTRTALADLTEADARTIVAFMLLRRLAAGTIFIREGEVAHNDFMMLILDGDVAVENEVTSMTETVVMSVIGVGSLIGEMGVLDGGPRSATCTAASDLAVAVLTREALIKLINKKPAVAARFMLAISKRLSDRLREANRKIRTLGGLSRALQGELDVAHRIKTRSATVGTPDLLL